ncbi:unnamed protein product [Discosporangium mesarthrocarpum]
MGGGAGVFMGASHRVVTEKAVFAMPEGAIGIVPDAGATHFLAKVPLHLLSLVPGDTQQAFVVFACFFFFLVCVLSQLLSPRVPRTAGVF